MIGPGIDPARRKTESCDGAATTAAGMAGRKQRLRLAHLAQPFHPPRDRVEKAGHDGRARMVLPEDDLHSIHANRKVHADVFDNTSFSRRRLPGDTLRIPAGLRPTAPAARSAGNASQTTGLAFVPRGGLP